jgi:hypothetical protein
VRELHEETGLLLGELQGRRLLTDLAALDYLCRAVTPPTRAMRFNARFLARRPSACGARSAARGSSRSSAGIRCRRRCARARGHHAQDPGRVRRMAAGAGGQRHLRPKIVYQGNDNRMSDE